MLNACFKSIRHDLCTILYRKMHLILFSKQRLKKEKKDIALSDYVRHKITPMGKVRMSVVYNNTTVQIRLYGKKVHHFLKAKI